MKQRSTVLTIITVICGFYLYELYDSGIIGTFALISTEYLQQSNQWYRLVTVALVHDNSNSIPIHLAFNMLALHSLGSPIEKLLGRTIPSDLLRLIDLCLSLFSAQLGL